MAYVAISQRLIECVSHNILDMKSREVQLNAKDTPRIESFLTTTSVPPESQQAMLKDFSDRAWGDYIEWREKTHPDFCQTSDRFGIQIKDAEGNQVYIDNSSNCQAAYVVVPPHATTYYTTWITLTIDEYKAKPWAKDFLDIDVYIEQTNKIKAIQNKWEDIRDKVLDFLDSVKSLNEAAKLWPDIRLYIPQEYLTKLDEKREVAQRKTKERNDNALDILAELEQVGATQAAVANKIIGGV